MSRQTHVATRRGNLVYIKIEDGRRSTKKNATEIAAEMLKPGEVLDSVWSEDPHRNYWIAEIDPLRSHVRQQVIDLLLEDMDQVDAKFGEVWPRIGDYLDHLRDSIETLDEQHLIQTFGDRV